MNLPTDTFQQALASFAVLSEPVLRESDRRAPRTKLSAQLELTPWEDPASAHSVRIHDLSLGGIGIFHNTRLSLDEQFAIRLAASNEQSSLWLCDVIYWEPLAEDLYAIGAKFNRSISESQLSARRLECNRRFNGVLAKISHAIAWPLRKAS